MAKLIRRIENFLQTERGQRLLQYGYSFGAAIVIFGAMVKVLHIWGSWGNIIFGTGMAIECLVFILYGLDRPPKAYQWENVFPEIDGSSAPARNEKGFESPFERKQAAPSISEHYAYSSAASTETSGQPAFTTEASSSTHHPVEQLDVIADNVSRFAHATQQLMMISESLQTSYRHIIDNSQDISRNSLGYVQQMEALNKNIAGLNTIYEIQLKGISGQIDTLDSINKGLGSIKEMYGNAVPDSTTFQKEVEKMTLQIQELNHIYGRLINAMQPGGAKA